MKQVFYILFAVSLTGAVSLVVGNALLRALGAKLCRMEALFLGFVVGSACLSAVVLGLAEAGLARRGAFVAAALILIATAVWRGGHRLPTEGSAPMPLAWSVSFWAIYAVFGLVYLSAAMAPETSLDGTTHYLADVSRWAATFGPAHGGGIEMLFLFAFSIGKHSAAAMVEWLFLMMLPVGILAYARRIGEPRAGVVAAHLVFASPIIGIAGTMAAPDVALVAVAFAVFYLASRRLIFPAAVAGAFLAWGLAPWMLREFDKPILHLNGWYPRLPLDLAVHGARLDGLLGPVFLLVPLGLLTMRWPVGRRLIAAGTLLSAVCLGAMETRAVILGLPFWSVALALVLVRWRMTGPVVLAAHALMSWPGFIPLYADTGAWHLKGTGWRAALRIESEEQYLERTLPSYRLGRILEVMVPDGARILPLTPFQQVYHSRNIVDPERTDEGRRLREVLWAALAEERLPVRRYEIRFPERMQVRLVPEQFGGRGRWGINEVHAFRGETEIEVSNAAASPNPDDGRYAIDGNPATRWTSGRVAPSAMALELTLRDSVDRIVLLTTEDQGRPIDLDGGMASLSMVEPPPDLRAFATRALAEAGIGWLVVHVTDRGAFDLLGRAAEWHLDLRAIEDGYIVFELDSELH